MSQTSNNVQALNNFLAGEFENLEALLVNERRTNGNLDKAFNSLKSNLKELNKQNKNLQTKFNDEIYKNNNLINKIENLEIELINVNNTKKDLIDSNKKIIEKLNRIQKEFDDYKKEKEITKNNLQTQLNAEMFKNKQLNNKINNLEKELKERKEKIEDLEKKNRQFECELKAEKKENEEYKIIIEGDVDKLHKEIEKLKKRLEKWITIYFTSSNQEINRYPIYCKNTDEFKSIKEKLKKAFPKIDIENYNFILHAQKINESKSLEENEIKNDDVILLHRIDTYMRNFH